MHGFILLKSEDGKVIALGDQINIARGTQVVSRLVFHFRDGSIDDETTTFRQGLAFQLLTDHHVQRGPSFRVPLDVTIDTRSGTVTSADATGRKTSEHMDLSPDLSNGMISGIIESFPPGYEEMKVSYLASTPNPRVVHLSIKPDGKDSYIVAGSRRSSTRYRVHVDLGGVAGLVAPAFGKQPPDIEVWVEDGPVPAFIKLRGPLFEKGSIWTMELTSPAWTR